MVLGQHDCLMSGYEFAVQNGLSPRLRNHGNEAYVISENRIREEPGFLESARKAGLIEHRRRDNVILLYAVHPSDKGVELNKVQSAFISKWSGVEIGCNPNEHSEWTYLRRRAWKVEIRGNGDERHTRSIVEGFVGDAERFSFEIGWKTKKRHFTEVLVFLKAGLDNVITTLEMARGARSAFDAIRTLQKKRGVRRMDGFPVDITKFVLESRETEFEMGLVAWLAITGAEALLKAHMIQQRGALAILDEKLKIRAKIARNSSHGVQDFLS